MKIEARVFSALAAAALHIAVPAHAGSIRVSSNGIDSGTCGVDPPCATIAQAVTNAVDGDSIAVGPGSYAGTTINKAVSLTSSAGTGAATITGAVVLAADGILFGKGGKGFNINGTSPGVSIAANEVTVRGNAFSDMTTCLEVTSGSAASVRDNIFDTCVTGISVLSASASSVRGNRFGYSQTAAISLGSGSSAAIVRENRTSGPSGAGIVVSGADHLIYRNLIHGSPAGGITTTGTPTNVEVTENLSVSVSGPSYYISTGSGWVLSRNAAVGGGVAPAFYLTAGTTAVLNGNLAFANAAEGFMISGGNDHVLINNSAIQNGGQGLLLASVGTGVTVTGGNLYGNGGTNCGLTNSSPNSVVVSEVYWGDPAGPGLDPADGLCGNTGAIVNSDPAASAYKTKMPSIK